MLPATIVFCLPIIWIKLTRNILNYPDLPSFVFHHPYFSTAVKCQVDRQVSKVTRTWSFRRDAGWNKSMPPTSGIKTHASLSASIPIHWVLSTPEWRWWCFEWLLLLLLYCKGTWVSWMVIRKVVVVWLLVYVLKWIRTIFEKIDWHDKYFDISEFCLWQRHHSFILTYIIRHHLKQL